MTRPQTCKLPTRSERVMEITAWQLNYSLPGGYCFCFCTNQGITGICNFLHEPVFGTYRSNSLWFHNPSNQPPVGIRLLFLVSLCVAIEFLFEIFFFIFKINYYCMSYWFPIQWWFLFRIFFFFRVFFFKSITLFNREVQICC